MEDAPNGMSFWCIDAWYNPRQKHTECPYDVMNDTNIVGCTCHCHEYNSILENSGWGSWDDGGLR